MYQPFSLGTLRGAFSRVSGIRLAQPFGNREFRRHDAYSRLERGRKSTRLLVIFVISVKRSEYLACLPSLLVSWFTDLLIPVSDLYENGEYCFESRFHRSVQRFVFMCHLNLQWRRV